MSSKKSSVFVFPFFVVFRLSYRHLVSVMTGPLCVVNDDILNAIIKFLKFSVLPEVDIFRCLNICL